MDSLTESGIFSGQCIALKRNDEIPEKTNETVEDFMEANVTENEMKGAAKKPENSVSSTKPILNASGMLVRSNVDEDNKEFVRTEISVPEQEVAADQFEELLRETSKMLASSAIENAIRKLNNAHGASSKGFDGNQHEETSEASHDVSCIEDNVAVHQNEAICQTGNDKAETEHPGVDVRESEDLIRTCSNSLVVDAIVDALQELKMEADA